MFIAKNNQKETDQTLLSLFELSSQKIQNGRTRSFNNMKKIRAALVDRTTKEATATLETSNQSCASKDYYCSGKYSKHPPQPINVEAIEKSKDEPLFYNSKTTEYTTDPENRQCRRQSISNLNKISPVSDLNLSLPQNLFETIRKHKNIPKQSRTIVFTSKSPIVACSWQQNFVKLTISPNSSENGERSLQVSEIDSDDRREKIDLAAERLKYATQDKQHVNEVTNDVTQLKISQSSLQKQTIDRSANTSNENPSSYPNNRLDHGNVLKTTTNDRHHNITRNSNLHATLAERKDGELSCISYNTKRNRDKFVVFSNSENTLSASSDLHAYFGKHASTPKSTISYLCQNSLNRNQNYFRESDEKLYVETPLIHQNLTGAQTETGLMAVKTADNQLIIYECNCTRCAQLHKIPRRNLTAIGVAGTKNKANFKKFLKKDCLIPAKSKSIGSDSSYRIAKILSHCFHCMGGETDSDSSGGSDSENDGEEGREEGEEYQEHGDGVSVGEDSGGGDSGSDSEECEDSFDSAEMFDDGNNVPDTKQEFGDDNGSDGVPSLDSDNSDSVMELRAMRCLKHRKTDNEYDSDDDDDDDDDDDGSGYSDDWWETITNFGDY